MVQASAWAKAVPVQVMRSSKIVDVPATWGQQDLLIDWMWSVQRGLLGFWPEQEGCSALGQGCLMGVGELLGAKFIVLVKHRRSAGRWT